MAKHDRRETSGQAPDSRPVTIQVPLPVLGVLHGVREALHGLCIATGLQDHYHVLARTFVQLARRLGLRGPVGTRGVSLHKLRHSFAVSRLAAWAQQGVVVRDRLPTFGRVTSTAASTRWTSSAAPRGATRSSGNAVGNGRHPGRLRPLDPRRTAEHRRLRRRDGERPLPKFNSERDNPAGGACGRSER